MHNDQPLDLFVPLVGDGRPTILLDRHPSGRSVALRVSSLNEAAVWDSESGHLAWNPGAAVALCWLRDGNEIIVLREYTLERRTWPTHTVLSCAGRLAYLFYCRACSQARQGAEGEIGSVPGRLRRAQTHSLFQESCENGETKQPAHGYGKRPAQVVAARRASGQIDAGSMCRIYLLRIHHQDVAPVFVERSGHR